MRCSTGWDSEKRFPNGTVRKAVRREESRDRRRETGRLYNWSCLANWRSVAVLFGTTLETVGCVLWW